MSHIIMISGGTKYDGDYLAGVTLPFPPLTDTETQKAGRSTLADYAHQAAAQVLVQAQADARKARRISARLRAYVAGGFQTIEPNHRGRAPMAVTPSTLFQNRDFPVLNDYRAVLGGLFARLYGLSPAQCGQVFAGVAPKDLGLL